jgi:hypothetical protein
MSYHRSLTGRGEVGRPPNEPLDLKFGLADSSQSRPLRIIELQPQSATGSAKLHLPEVEFVVEGVGDEESVNVVDIKGNPDVAGLRSRSDEALVLRAEKDLLTKLVRETVAESETPNLAILTTSEQARSLPILTMSDQGWVREKRMALRNEVAGRFPPLKSDLEGVVGFLKTSQSGGNHPAEVLRELLGYFGVEPSAEENKPSGNKPEQNADAKAERNALFSDAATELSKSKEPGAKEAKNILSQSPMSLDVSRFKESLLAEFEKRLRQEKEKQQADIKHRQGRAQKALDELFAGRHSLLPAGDYILGLSHKGKDDKNPIFYPAMKVHISFDREVKDQKGYPEGQKSVIRPAQTPQTQ